MANGSYSAGNLFLNIDSVATNTIKNLDAVIDRLNIINNGLSKTSKSSKLSSSNVGAKNKSLSNFLNICKWTAIIHSVRRFGRIMGQIVQKGSDFGETLNLWQVSMGEEFLPTATEFVNKLNEAYGISKKTLMNSQAIFKNMLGSLGEISEQTAYKLSEGITQMALDYASLYNVKFEDAMTKFQAALAGQVRPIRSVAGYDITENTLFQLYQTLGGTKTMRQLSRTEKQLLAIYAVFNQMDRSGAVGDLDRTINSFANQSRVMADAWEEVLTYAGLVTTRLLEQWQVMKYVNAVLIFMSRILEGIAHSLDNGSGQSGGVFGDIESSADNSTEAVEKLKESLLDFDKFRALDQTNSVSENLGVDQTILDAVTRYDSILEDASLEARDMADSWLKSLGFIDENNDGIIDIKDGVFEISNLIDNLDWNKISEGLINSSEWILNTISEVLNNIDWEQFATAFGNFISWSFESINELIDKIDWKKVGEGIGKLIDAIDWGTVLFGGNEIGFNLAIAFTEAIVYALMNIDWGKLIIDLLYKPFENLLVNIGYKIADIFGFDLGGNRGDKKFFGLFANGGLPDRGTMFFAGEAGAEMVYNMPNGQSGVANVSQIKQAMYQAMVEYGRTQSASGQPIVVYLDGEVVYQNTTSHAQQHGNIWANA